MPGSQAETIGPLLSERLRWRSTAVTQKTLGSQAARCILPRLSTS